MALNQCAVFRCELLHLSPCLDKAMHRWRCPSACVPPSADRRRGGRSHIPSHRHPHREALDRLNIITVQRRWRLEAIENDADGALILAATYDHSLPVGETWASSRSKWTHLYPITNLNFDRVTNHGGCHPMARCRALKFYQPSNPGGAHLIRNLRAPGTLSK